VIHPGRVTGVAFAVDLADEGGCVEAVLLLESEHADPAATTMVATRAARVAAVAVRSIG
jgi:hypothetical protein